MKNQFQFNPLFYSLPIYKGSAEKPKAGISQIDLLRSKSNYMKQMKSELADLKLKAMSGMPSSSGKFFVSKDASKFWKKVNVYQVKAIKKLRDQVVSEAQFEKFKNEYKAKVKEFLRKIREYKERIENIENQKKLTETVKEHAKNTIQHFLKLWEDDKPKGLKKSSTAREITTVALAYVGRWARTNVAAINKITDVTATRALIQDFAADKPKGKLFKDLEGIKKEIAKEVFTRWALGESDSNDEIWRQVYTDPEWESNFGTAIVTSRYLGGGAARKVTSDLGYKSPEYSRTYDLWDNYNQIYKQGSYHKSGLRNYNGRNISVDHGYVIDRLVQYALNPKSKLPNVPNFAARKKAGEKILTAQQLLVAGINSNQRVKGSPAAAPESTDAPTVAPAEIAKRKATFKKVMTVYLGGLGLRTPEDFVFVVGAGAYQGDVVVQYTFIEGYDESIIYSPDNQLFGFGYVGAAWHKSRLPEEAVLKSFNLLKKNPKFMKAVEKLNHKRYATILDRDLGKIAGVEVGLITGKGVYQKDLVHIIKYNGEELDRTYYRQDKQKYGLRKTDWFDAKTPEACAAGNVKLIKAKIEALKKDKPLKITEVKIDGGKVKVEGVNLPESKEVKIAIPRIRADLVKGMDYNDPRVTKTIFGLANLNKQIAERVLANIKNPQVRAAVAAKFASLEKAGELKKYLKLPKIPTVYVIGRASLDGSFAGNMNLAKRRARSAIQFIKAQAKLKGAKQILANFVPVGEVVGARGEKVTSANQGYLEFIDEWNKKFPNYPVNTPAQMKSMINRYISDPASTHKVKGARAWLKARLDNVRGVQIEVKKAPKTPKHITVAYKNQAPTKTPAKAA